MLEIYIVFILNDSLKLIVRLLISDREYISVGRGESSDNDDDDDGMDYVIDLSVVANSNHQDASRHQIAPRSTAASRTFSTVVCLPFHVILLLVLSRIGC